MTDAPRLSLSGIVLDSPDAQDLASFYERLLGWRRTQDEPGWAKLHDVTGGAGLSFQTEMNYVRPVWPAGEGDPQMAVHLDISVDDLEASTRHALAAGGVLAHVQPQEDVRVFIDPAGHPFCLFLGPKPDYHTDQG